MYTFQSRVRFSELDEEGKLGIGAIVDYFQDCSTFQSEALGVGLPYMKEKGLVWLMSFWQIEIDSCPGLCEEITIGTSPYEFKGFMGYRNFCLEDASGKRIIRANSIWTLMNMKTMRPARATQEMLEAYRLEPKLEMNYAPRKIPLPGEGCRQPSFQVGRQNLDSNGHVNNGQYIHMAQAYLPEGFEIGGMRAEYRKSALLHDVMAPLVYGADDLITVSLADEAGQPYAVVEFTRRTRPDGTALRSGQRSETV